MADSQNILQRALLAMKYTFTGNTDWFGPQNPLPPMAPPETAGRQFDYPVGFNLNFRPRSDEKVGFDKLKALANGSDILRIVIEGQKDKLEALDWQIKPKGGKGKADSSATAIQAALESPDQVHDWPQWLRMLLEQNYVLDAVSVYRRRTLAGKPYSFEILDGATIKPVIDASGRRPAPPLPAYQQILKGVPAVDYTAAELLYYPQNKRADHVYGYSRVEQIVNVVETVIERLKSQRAFFRDGNLSDGFFSAPPTAQPDQVFQVEAKWNSLISGGVESRRIAQFLPSGFEWNPIGQPVLQDAIDEWLARVICFAFSTAPTPFLKQQGLGHGSATSEHDAAEAAGLGNTMAYVKRLMTRIIAEDFGRPDLEFDWIEDREFDPKTKADIEDKRLRNGSLTLDEVRDRNGEDPLADGLGSKPLIYTAAGATLLDTIVNPPEPEPVPDALAEPGQAGSPAAAEPGKTGTEDDAKLGKAASNKAEGRLATAVARFLGAREAEVIAVLAPKLGLTKAAPSDPSSEDYSRRIDDAFDEIDWDWTPLAKTVTPLLTGIAVAAGKDAVSDLGLFDKAVLAKMTATATDYADTRGAEMVGKKLVDGELVDNPGWSIPDATRHMVRSAVSKAMEEGASNDELATAIRDSGAFSRERAETIARTETAKADTQGAIAGWKAAGKDVVAGKRWLTAPDCCDDCQALDGEVVGIDDEFEGGDPPAHPNCRCSVAPVTPDEMDDEDLGKAFNEDQPRDENGRWSGGIGLSEHVDEALADNQSQRRTELGPVTDANAEMVRNETGMEISGFNRVVDSDDIRHAMNQHGDPVKEALRTPPQKAITADDIKSINDVVDNAHSVKLSGKAGGGSGQRLRYVANLNGHEVHYVEQVRSGKELVALKTMWKK